MRARPVLTTVTGDSPVTRLTDPGALPATYASAGRDGLAELLTVEDDRTAIPDRPHLRRRRPPAIT